ncbi:MAG: PepSY domain-containing protein [Halieaceae bacterium]|jgi:hypothetical protein|nr:PepSY domain-containing protein [Halieaceae bacterium]
MRKLRTLHRWLGLLVFLQVLIWMGSGLVISLVDAGVARGSTTLQQVSTTPLDAVAPQALTALNLSPTVENIRLTRIDGEPVYRLATPERVTLIHAETGRPLMIDAERARRIARASFAGDASIVAATREERPAALAKFEGTAWRVGFGDSLATDVYVDAADGRVLGHRNNRSALVEFLLKLHFMDYNGGHDFNHPLIIVAAFLALWLALSGALLLISSLRRVGLR